MSYVQLTIELAISLNAQMQLNLHAKRYTSYNSLLLTKKMTLVNVSTDVISNEIDKQYLVVIYQVHIKNDFLPACIRVILDSPKIIWLCYDSMELKDLLKFNFDISINISRVIPIEKVITVCKIGDSYNEEAGLNVFVEKLFTKQLPHIAPNMVWNAPSLSQLQQSTVSLHVFGLWMVGRVLVQTCTRAFLEEHMGEELSVNALNSLATTIQLAEKYAKVHHVDIRSFYSTEGTRARIEEVTRIFLDIFHGMGRVKDLVPKEHPFRYFLIRMLRDAIFVPFEDDVKRVDAYLRDHEGGITFEDKRKASPKWISARVRFYVPPKDQLKSKLTGLLELFQDAVFTVDKIPLVNQKCKDAWNTLISDHVEKGCLSDPVGLSIYSIVGSINGLPIYRSNRGTEVVESLNRVLRDNFQSFTAGPRISNNYLLLLMYTQTILASQKYRRKFPNSGHFAHHLFNSISILQKRIFGRTLQSGCWEPMENYASFGVKEYFGIGPIISPVLNRRQVTESERKKVPASLQYVIGQIGNTWPTGDVTTKAEEILFQHNVNDPKYVLPRGQINFELLASDFNHGRLSIPSPMNHLFNNEGTRHDILKILDTYRANGGPCLGVLQKLPLQLRQFYDKLQTRSRTRSLMRATSMTLHQIRRYVTDHINEILPPKAFDAVQLPLLTSSQLPEDPFDVLIRHSDLVVNPMPLLPDASIDPMTTTMHFEIESEHEVVNTKQRRKSPSCPLCHKTAAEGCGVKSKCRLPCRVQGCSNCVSFRCKFCAACYCDPHKERESHSCTENEKPLQTCKMCFKSAIQCPGATYGAVACTTNEVCNKKDCDTVHDTQCEVCTRNFCSQHIKRRHGHRCSKK